MSTAIAPDDATSMAVDVRDVLRNGPMSALQFTALAVCVGLNMLDGFDVLVMSFAASGVSGEWALSGSKLGLLLSAGLVGMAAGSLAVGPRADQYGRRRIVLVSVTIVSIGMLLSGFADNFLELGLLRVITGIGIGGILASATVLVAEFSPDRWRNTASCLYTAGFPIGATVGGAIAAGLMTRYGWRSAFHFGTVISVVMLPLVYWGLPESVDFLLARRPIDALPRINEILRRMNRTGLSALPAPGPAGSLRTGTSLHRLRSAPLVRTTNRLWLAYFFMMAGYYFVFSWTPRLLTASGMTAQQGITGGVLLSLGGIMGTVVFAFTARVVEIRRLTCIGLLAAGVLMPLFAVATESLVITLVTGMLLGGLVSASMAGIYALTPPLYPADVRTTGMGWAIGLGRFGAILAPIATGILVDYGWGPALLYEAFAITFVVSLLALASIGPLSAAGRGLSEGRCDV